MKTKIKEIFTSIQGEGPYVGYKQLFVRFCKCNLMCKYCDTDFDSKNTKEYSPDELVSICKQYPDCHSVSLTGGEPLADIKFLEEFIPNSPLEVYLETNGTLYNELRKVIDKVAYVAMDIKLPSCTGMASKFNEHDKFLEIASMQKTFVKIVFDSNITNEEIANTANLCSKYNVELILQPKMNGNVLSVTSDFMTDILNKYLAIHPKTRLIPQVHKFLNVL